MTNPSALADEIQALAWNYGRNDISREHLAAQVIARIPAIIRALRAKEPAEAEELRQQLKTVLDRESATTARYDAKLDKLEADTRAEVEREIVAWLRFSLPWLEYVELPEIADAIEAGEHRSQTDA